MEERIVEDTTTNEQFVSYFHYLWKDRLNWTKHVIPVRFKVPDQEFFLEGYISAPPSPDDLNLEIEVESAFLFTDSINTFSVPIKDIYPSKRNLTKIKDQTIQPNDVLKEYHPVISCQDITKIFTTFPRYSFTLAEIESILNRVLNPKEISRLILGKKKLCLINNKVEDAYTNIAPALLFFGEKPMDICENLDQLAQKYKNCTDCALGQKRTSRGRAIVTNRLGLNLNTKPTSPFIMFIGEAPGEQEEQNGIPFYPEAPAGDLLKRVITAARIDLDSCYFTNAVLCRPEPKDPQKSQNGTPTKEEVIACNTRLKNEIAIINPKIIVLLGKTAYYSVFGKDLKTLLDVTGWQPTTSKIYLVAHPSYVIRELGHSNIDNKNQIKKNYLNHFIEIKKEFDNISKK